MIRALLATSMLVATSAASAQQPPAQRRIEIVGEAPAACLLRGDGKARGSNMSFQALGSSAGEIRIGQLVDASTAVPRAANVQLILPIICNGPHRVVVRSVSGGLVRIGAGARQPSSAFRENLPYELGAIWDGRVFRQASDAAGDFVIDSSNGRAADLTLSISVRGGGRPLVAGNYSDTITVRFQAAD